MTTMLPPSLTPTTLPKVIAVIGCDGSGKSTLTTDLFNYLQSKQVVKLIYLGQSSGNIAHWIKSLPIIGTPFERYLVKKAERAHDKKIALRTVLRSSSFIYFRSGVHINFDAC